VQPRLTSVDTETVLFAACVDVEVAVDRVQLLDVHVIDEPHRPHGVHRPASLELAVPFGRQRVRYVRTKVRSDGRLVFVKPVLQRDTNAVSLLVTYQARWSVKAKF